MSGWRFAHPEWVLPLAALLVGVAALLAVAVLRARRRLRALLGAAPPGPRLPGARDLVLWLALACTCAALVGPVVGRRLVRVPASGVDVVIVVDVSRSMDARDVPPSRLARARQHADRVLSGLRAGDRAALAAFAGRGVLLTPLTPDKRALAEMLPALDADLLRPLGSQIGSGVSVAAGAFERGSPRPRVILLLSDGEDHSTDPTLGRGAARAADARVVAVGFGSEAGATVPDHGVPLRDRRGGVVRSRRITRGLARLAEGTGGALWLADAWGRVDDAALLAALRRDAGRAPGEPVERRLRAARVLPFAAGAFALLALEALARGAPFRGRRPADPRARRRLRLGSRNAAAAALALVALGASPGGPAPLEAHRLLARGLALARAGELEAAMRALEAAAVRARSPERAALAYYDLGVVALEARRLPRARDAFLDALALRPRDERARFNLEWTLRALAEAQAAAPPGPGAAAPRAARPEPPGDPSDRSELEAPPPRPPVRARPLAAGEAARWLVQLQDDASRSLREAARAQVPPAPRAPPGAPTW